MEFQIKESTRTRHLRITIAPDGTIILTKPTRISLPKAESFFKSHLPWIESIQKKFEDSQKRQEKLCGPTQHLPRLRRNTTAYRAAILEAKELIKERVPHFASQGVYKYTSISIRNQKTRWGSCSARGTLSFNYRVIYLTPEELDYLVIHELAHTKHHNHGKEFWLQVAKHIPEYKELGNALKRYRW